jgi:pyruvate formate lyase activating enzyme
MDLGIKGIQKSSLIDYPGKICSVIFMEGCNFRCPFCHNPELVLKTDTSEDIDSKEFLDFLLSQKKWIDGVCITGGEPTLNKDLPLFIKKIKDLGFLVSLHTNGSNPKMLQELIDNNLLDYVAMDIKGPKESYSNICGNVKINLGNIEKSINIIKNPNNSKQNPNFEYEFRTTIIPEFIKEKDLIEIGKWLNGSNIYYLQQFCSNNATLDPNFNHKTTYNLNDLNHFASILKPYFKKIEIRGV